MDGSRSALMAALVVAGCGQRPYECDRGGAPDGEALRVISPPDGLAQGGPWTPLIAEVRARDVGARVVTCLDGAPADDPLGLVRLRRSLYGGGWDYVGLVDLEQVGEGAHDLWFVVERPAGLGVGAVSFTVARAAHRIDVDVRDPSGAPIDARVLVTDANDVPIDVVALSPDVDPSERDLSVSSVFAIGGHATLWLDEGTWRFRAMRGVLDTVGYAEVVVVADATVPLVVAPAVDLPGYVAADLHVHTGASYDSILPDRVRYESLAAGGLDVVVVTDHNVVVDPRPAIDLAVPGGELHGVPGIEADLRKPGGTDQPDWDLGHFNAYPVRGADAAPIPGVEADPIGEAVGAWRERQWVAPYPGLGSEVVLQLNHPRGIHFWPHIEPNREAWPLFEQLGFDRDVPPGEGTNAWMAEPDPLTGATALDFDALEVVNRFSWPLYLDVRRDWFALLDAGFFMTGTGNSDSHALEVETAGLPVNLVRTARPAAGESLDVNAFVTALREGHVLVSTGPVVELTTTSGPASAGPGDSLFLTGPVTATVRVRAAPWVPVPEARLVVDGVVAHRWDVPVPQAGQGVDVTFEAAVAPQRWLLAEAGWPVEGLSETRGIL